MNNKTFRDSISQQCGFTPNKAERAYQGGIWSDAHCNDFKQGVNYTAVQACNAGDWPDVIDEACDSQGVHWQQGTDREWKATGYCCANCLEIDQRMKGK